MRVRFRVNLGSIDAAQHQLDWQKCQLGMTLDVDDAAGDWLVQRGIAETVQVVKAVPPPAAIKAVPPPVEHGEKADAKPKKAKSDDAE